eukprot:7937207-Alexandrium_andersonii.AAC.1
MGWPIHSDLYEEFWDWGLPERSLEYLCSRVEARLGLQAGAWALVADAAGPMPRAEASLQEVNWARVRALRLLPR